MKNIFIDTMALAGFAVLIWGVAMLSYSVAMIVGGGAMVAIAFLLQYKTRQIDPVTEPE